MSKQTGDGNNGDESTSTAMTLLPHGTEASRAALKLLRPIIAQLDSEVDYKLANFYYYLSK
ncbi:unnamed protein product [Protopolystoma xenopodis]|uniref:Uncharacterized protein n=1 Tax=Protopolystoma xenopodis TaxID=117903 RepID=A0A448WYR9_9PLAT|nr:unnamed protein product [Protopolystoma xenopodis]